MESEIISNDNIMVSFEETEKTYDIVFSFDTTSSMNSCIMEVRKNLENLVNRLFADIQNLRIGVIAHGDYEDENKTYLMKQVDLTNDKEKIVDFIKNVGKTCGYDLPEAYEYVLHKSRELAWESDIKILVMIGDSVPHEKNENKYKLDWKMETKILAEMGVNVYGVQCLNQKGSTYFYQTLAELSKGYYLELSEFSSISDLILTVCYKQVDDEIVRRYEREMENDGRLTNGMRRVVDVILERKPSSNSGYVNLGNIIVAEPSKDGARFDILDVDNNCNAQKYLNDKKIIYDEGNIFCEITKPKLIDNGEKIIVMYKENGNIYEGKESMKVLGMKNNFVKRQRLKIIPNYRIFIKCKKRDKLEANTKLLHERKDIIVI
jgi:Mg-chelatase subunit ChlD